MLRRSTCILLCWFGYFCVAGLSAALGQPSSQPERSVADELSDEAIDAQIKAVEEAANLDDAAKAEIKRTLAEAKTTLANARSVRAEAARFAARIQTVAERKKQVQRWLDNPPVAPTDAEIASLDRKALEELLSTWQQKLSEARQLAADLSQEANRRLVAPNENPQLIEAKKAELAKVSAELGRGSPAAQSPRETAQRLLLMAKKALLEAELEMLQNELAYYQASADLFGLEQRWSAVLLTAAESADRRIRARMKMLREKETKSATQRLVEELQQADFAPPLQKIADQVIELAKERARRAEERSKYEAELEATKKAYDKLVEEFDRTKSRVESIGLTPTIGLFLRTKRSSLREIGVHDENVENRQELVPDLRLRLYELEDQRLSLVKQLQHVRAAQTQGKPLEGYSPEELIQLDDLITKKLTLVEGLYGDYLELLRVLGELDAAERSLVRQSREFAKYIDQRILWIPSAEWIRLDDLRQSVNGMVAVISPMRWQEAWSSLVRGILSAPVLSGLLALLLLLFSFSQRLLRRRVTSLGEQVRKQRSLSVWLTLRALLATVAISIYWPLLLWVTAWLLDAGAERAVFASDVASALRAAAGFYLPFEFLRQLCRGNGIAETHFNWPMGIARAVRAELRWYVPLGAALVFVTRLFDGGAFERWQATSGRVFFMLTMFVSMVAAYRVVGPGRPLLRHLMAAQKLPSLTRMRYLWWGTLEVVLSAILLAAALGYYYTAQQLAARLLTTVYVPLALAVLGGVATQWARVLRREVGLARLRRRAKEGGQPSGDGGVGTPPPQDHVEPNLATIGKQTNRFIGGLLFVLGVVLIWRIWDDMVPALEFMANNRLFGLTIGQLGYAAAVVVATYFLVKNVPGVIEVIASLRELDSGSKHAVQTLVIYALVGGGIALTAGALGMKWSSIQWLVAALSVGIGFGLQEIVANFVSGLIILFERPIRIGDFVSIDDIQGTVTHIRIRSTVITNLQRQELIVPNKDLITGRVLNWTLSDPINRIDIIVGVAYGTDVHRTREILSEIVSTEPRVCSEPAPIVMFNQFGDSALQFAIRAFLPNLEHRWEVINDLHASINDRLNEEGIVIAFPQLDVHFPEGMPVPSSPPSPQAPSGA